MALQSSPILPNAAELSEDTNDINALAANTCGLYIRQGAVTRAQRRLITVVSGVIGCRSADALTSWGVALGGDGIGSLACSSRIGRDRAIHRLSCVAHP
jgi:hypothetical protein